MRFWPVAARSAAAIVMMVALALSVSGCARHGNSPGSTPAPSDGSKPVPAAYQQLYSELKADMDGYNASLDVRSSTYTHPICGAELLPANGNRGEQGGCTEYCRREIQSDG